MRGGELTVEELCFACQPCANMVSFREIRRALRWYTPSVQGSVFLVFFVIGYLKEGGGMLKDMAL